MERYDYSVLSCLCSTDDDTFVTLPIYEINFSFAGDSVQDMHTKVSTSPLNMQIL